MLDTLLYKVLLQIVVRIFCRRHLEFIGMVCRYVHLLPMATKRGGAGAGAVWNHSTRFYVSTVMIFMIV